MQKNCQVTICDNGYIFEWYDFERVAKHRAYASSLSEPPTSGKEIYKTHKQILKRLEEFLL